MNLLAVAFTVFFSTVTSLVFYTGLNYCIAYFQYHHQLIFFFSLCRIIDRIFKPESVPNKI